MKKYFDFTKKIILTIIDTHGKIFRMEDKMLKVKEIMEILNVSRGTVYNLIHAKKFPVYKIEGATRIWRSDIETYLKQQKQP